MAVREMTFTKARYFLLPFGKYKGKQIDVVAASDEGLQHLDWLRGRKEVTGPLLAALSVYLSDGLIADSLDELLADVGDDS